jgi:hypothetical protein
MAKKKITDLQLISSIVDGLSVPSDNGIQSYRFTGAQLKAFILANQAVLLANLKDDIFSGLTAVAPADDDYFPLIDTGDSNKTKKGLVGTFKNAVYRAVTTTDSVGVSDETMELSGSSFTSTLPTAVGVAGKKYCYIHNGTTGTNIYTIATTSGQTVGPNASGDYKLYAKGERLQLQSNGANWIIIAATPKMAIIEDSKSANTEGGTFTGGSMQTRVLNTIRGDSTIVSLSSNQFTLIPGTYQIEWSAPAYSGAASSTIGGHKSKLRNITDSTNDIIGTSERIVRLSDASQGQTQSRGFGLLTLTASKTFEIQHQCGGTSNTQGFGAAAQMSLAEVYTTVKIVRI